MKEEVDHGLSTVRKIGTPMHQYQSLKSITIHNSTKIEGNEGGKVSGKFGKRLTPSPLTFSSPTSTLPFDLNFVKRYPAAVAEHCNKNM